MKDKHFWQIYVKGECSKWENNDQIMPGKGRIFTNVFFSNLNVINVINFPNHGEIFT